MNNVRIQWLSSDEKLFEADWLGFLFSDVQDYLEIEFDWRRIRTDENTILICNHAVPYRNVLEELRQNGKKYAIVLLSDENLHEPCEWLHDPACIKLHRNYIHPNHLNHPKVQFFGLGYKRELLKYLNSTNSQKTYSWCFAGTPHGERQKMLDIFQEVKDYKIHTCSGFGAEDGLNTEKYAEMLQQSVFALCPEGQDSMDSFRLYEALEAGCIPVTRAYSKQFMIKPSYWHAVFYGVQELPFVWGETFEDCLSKMRTVPTQEIETVAQQCKKLWMSYKNIWKNQFTETFNLLKH